MFKNPMYNLLFDMNGDGKIDPAEWEIMKGIIYSESEEEDGDHDPDLFDHDEDDDLDDRDDEPDDFDDDDFEDLDDDFDDLDPDDDF